jgi:hypothetical protein
MSANIADMAVKVATAWTVAFPIMVVLSFAVSALALNRLAALDRWLSTSQNRGSPPQLTMIPDRSIHSEDTPKSEAREHKREHAPTDSNP